MQKTKSYQYTVSKTVYEKPKIDLIQFSCEDIITTSGDPNQGEWDPQKIYLIL